MAFDFSNVVNTATDVVAKTTDTDKVVYPYPLVYPTPGQTIVVKLLFNPASNSVVRLVNRHEKVPCYKSYGIECPICKAMQQVVDTTGQDPFGKSKSKSRGISFAKLISSTKPIEYGGERDKKTLSPGDTILLMYPWSVYTQINQLISAVASTPSGMERAFCSADQGLFIQISVSNEYKYSTTNVPFFTYATGLTDEQYMKSLEEMPNLNDQVIPAKIDDKVNAQVKEYADNIYREFISPRVPNQNPTATTPVFANTVPTIPVAPNNTTGGYVPNPTVNISQTTPTVETPSRPLCFGGYVENEPKCICCPYEVECMAKKNSDDPEIPF